MPKKEVKSWSSDLKKEKPVTATFEFKDSASAEEYLEWKREVPIEFRRIIESSLRSTEVFPNRQTGLSLTDQFLNKFTEAVWAKNLLDITNVDNKRRAYLQNQKN